MIEQVGEDKEDCYEDQDKYFELFVFDLDWVVYIGYEVGQVVYGLIKFCCRYVVFDCVFWVNISVIDIVVQWFYVGFNFDFGFYCVQVLYVNENMRYIYIGIYYVIYI